MGLHDQLKKLSLQHAQLAARLRSAGLELRRAQEMHAGIDRSLLELVEAGEPDPRVRPITEMQVALIERLIAEGVATSEQLDRQAESLHGVTWRAMDAVQADAMIRALQARGNRPPVEPPDDPPPVDPPAEPPTGWAPPQVGLHPLPEPTNACPVVETWAGRRVQLGAGAKDCLLEGQTVNKISGSGQWGHALFRDCTIQNELNSLCAVGASDNEPKDIQPGETWKTSERATPYGGWMLFEDCRFQPDPDAHKFPHQYQGLGGKMWLHPEAPCSLYLGDCDLERVWEHGFYPEWPQHVHIENCVFRPCGGTAIQVTSRGGHGPVGDYTHGNPLNRPAGLDGWALIRGTAIYEEFFGFRDASDISFAGFLGPIVIEDVACLNVISAVAIYSDPFKGAWLQSEDGGEPILWRKEVEGKQPPEDMELYQASDGTWFPVGYYANRGAWIHKLTVTLDSVGLGRGVIMLSGGVEWHLGELDIADAPGVPAIIFDAWWGGKVRNKRRPGSHLPNAYFHDRASAMRLLGRIGEDVPHPTQPGKGQFRPFTLEELESLIV